ncbi:MAG: hypothetical protein IJ867_00930 [Clostridia bacterium]|nr:hypothetical protein [Clostridia bacterium]
MHYSDYSLDSVTNEEYEKVCNILLKGSKKDEIKKKVESILYEGGYEGFSVDSNEFQIRNNPSIERKKRIGFSYLLATHPETFETLRENHINLFHGTNVNALPNILKYGMKSVDDQSAQGIETTTGETWSRFGGKRDYISVTDDIDTALDYSSKGNGQTDFGVVIGISSDSLRKLRRCNVHSSLPELGIEGSIPLEHIKFLGVPEEKLEFVQKLVGDLPIKVAPINIKERFYYINAEDEMIYIEGEDKVNQYIEGKSSPQKRFNAKEIGEVAKTRKMSAIRKLYEKAKSKILNMVRGDGDERD